MKFTKVCSSLRHYLICKKNHVLTHFALEMPAPLARLCWSLEMIRLRLYTLICTSSRSPAKLSTPINVFNFLWDYANMLCSVNLAIGGWPDQLVQSSSQLNVFNETWHLKHNTCTEMLKWVFECVIVVLKIQINQSTSLIDQIVLDPSLLIVNQLSGVKLNGKNRKKHLFSHCCVQITEPEILSFLSYVLIHETAEVAQPS